MFVRSILALSLSCLLTGTAFAASTAEQPLTPKKVAAPVEDPIDPLAIDSSASSVETQISQQEQQDLDKAANTLQNLEKTEDKNSGTAIAPSSPQTTTAKTA
ncbi:MAG: murein L,D-transpeptidase, partial [Acinetobacter sp.]